MEAKRVRPILESVPGDHQNRYSRGEVVYDPGTERIPVPVQSQGAKVMARSSSEPFAALAPRSGVVLFAPSGLAGRILLGHGHGAKDMRHW